MQRQGIRGFELVICYIATGRAPALPRQLLPAAALHQRSAVLQQRLRQLYIVLP